MQFILAILAFGFFLGMCYFIDADSKSYSWQETNNKLYIWLCAIAFAVSACFALAEQQYNSQILYNEALEKAKTCNGTVELIYLGKNHTKYKVFCNTK